MLRRLPGKLRNCIYGYTLSEEKGICYPKDKKGIKWLCLNETNVKIAEEASVATTMDDIIKGSSEGSRSQKRRKLNNVLPQDTTVEPKSIDIDQRVRASDTQYIVANQLRFVNRQLRQETKGLSLRQNNVYVRNPNVHICELLDSLSNEQRSWLRIIVSKVATSRKNDGNRNSRMDAVEANKALKYWCEVAGQYPKLSIQFCWKVAHVNRGLFFVLALNIHYIGRGNEAVIELSFNDAEVRRAMIYILESEPARMPAIPSCWRIFPWEEDFDEVKFEKVCLENDQYVRTFSDSIDMSILLAIARDWHRDGF
ncbi:hypothetical protein EK21DRAFT_118305 [Setomelanomma holmii]|uniref:Uncharacterized protein n=1 Tax=Setomelanomma holmii TaxID=210430 RepID=A0A9P4GZD6_9PLEO|nr:hypothetical protein EK21DRAFT_118305 [Setomelanomma holmii]